MPGESPSPPIARLRVPAAAAIRSLPARGAGRAILWGGLVCGALDLSYVLVFYGLRGVSARGILQGIAFSLLGKPAYAGGWASALLGFGLHFGVAFAAAALFQLLAWRLRFLLRHPVAGGLLYGVFFYVLMNTVVLRFTLIPVKTFPPANWPVILPAHLLFVGLPIALIARRLSPATAA